MRQKRAKAYRKLMHVYCMSFGFRQPYQVLVDSEMCSEAVSSKIDLARQLATVLQGNVKPMITQCSINRLYLAGKTAWPAVDLAKTFERRRCNHLEAEPEVECVEEVIGSANKHRYILAAQSTSLRQHARQIPGVPVVHVKRSVMVLEPASEATEKVKSAMEAERMQPSEAESSKIASTLGKPESTEPPKKKRRGPKGPNPLSVKKKKPKENIRQARARGDGAISGTKRKRSNDDEGDGDAPRVRGESAGGRPEIGATSKRKRHRTRKRRRVDEQQDKGNSGDNVRVESSGT